MAISPKAIGAGKDESVDWSKPVRGHGRPTKLTPTARAAFLNSLSEVPNVTLAATRAGVSRFTFYELRNADPEFAEEWDQALGIAVGLLEAEAIRRARFGNQRVRYHKDGSIAEVWTEYSDTLMIATLAAHHPAYRKNANPLDPENVKDAAKAWIDVLDARDDGSG